MILITTLKKLADKNAPVYIVTVPAYVIESKTVGMKIPAGRDVFATRAAAEKYADNMNPHKWGVAVSPTLTVSTAKAEALAQGWAF